MGLLDIFDSEQGRLGLGLLAMAGPQARPMGFGERLMGAYGMVDAMRQQKRAQELDEIKKDLYRAQIGETNAQAEERKAATAQKARRTEMLNNWMTQLDGSVPQANEAVVAQTGNLAPTLGNAALQSQAQQRLNADNPIAGLPRQAIQADLMLNEGKNIPEWILKRPNIEIQNGQILDRSTLVGGTALPQTSQDGKTTITMRDPSNPSGYRTMVVPGSLESYSGFLDAQERARANYNLVDVVNKDGSTTKVPASSFLPKGNFVGDPQQVSKAIAAIKDPQERANATAAFNEQMSRGWTQPSLRTGQSTSEKLAADAGGKINESWLKNAYEPTVAQGSAASGMLDNIQVARMGLQNIGSGGWGTDIKAAGANLLVGLGVAPKNAEMFATNAQSFQQAAMTRLWSTLNEAKGPQTEGDAQRASQTFAQLNNTPKANEFILDLAEAKARVDQMKARFYQQALPLAKEKGDLSEVDREWAKRAPSIWTMPSLQKWAGGIK